MKIQKRKIEPHIFPRIIEFAWHTRDLFWTRGGRWALGKGEEAPDKSASASKGRNVPKKCNVLHRQCAKCTKKRILSKIHKMCKIWKLKNHKSAKIYQKNETCKKRLQIYKIYMRLWGECQFRKFKKIEEKLQKMVKLGKSRKNEQK